MAFDFAAAKKRVRRIVHDTLAITAEYDDADTVEPVPLRVRWHYKQTVVGDLEAQGYPQSIDTINKVVFDREELAAKNVVISRGGRLKFTADGFGNAVVAVDTKDTMAGPTEEIWYVGRQPDGELNP